MVITVTGSNDAPTVESDTGAVTEAGNADPGTPIVDTTSTNPGAPTAGIPTASGTVTASDADDGEDVGEVDGLTFSGDATGTYGSFSINPATGAWQYQLNNADADTQALAEGETATEQFTVTVTDDEGATDTSTVTITVTGANDSPVISGTTTGSVTEEDPEDVVTTTGQLTSADVDVLGQTATWSVSPNSPGGTYGSLDVDNTGLWTYTLDSDAADGLTEGETATEVFTVRVTDDKGAWDDQEVVITVTGSNDAPTIDVDAASKLVDEKGLPLGSGELADGNSGNESDQSEVTTGTFTIADDDGLADIKSITLGSNELVIGDGVDEFADFAAMIGETFDTGQGVVEITSYAAGVFGYQYTLHTPETDGTGDDGINTVTAGDSFTVTVTDSADAFESATVDIDIIDDIPSGFTPESASVENTVNASLTDLSLDINDDDIHNNVGADQFGNLSFTVADGTAVEGSFAGGEAEVLTSGGNPIYYYVVDNFLYGSTTALADWDAENPDNLVFQVELKLDTAGSDFYDFDLFQKIDPQLTEFTVEGNDAYDFVGGNTDYIYFDIDDAAISPDILISPLAYDGTSTTLSGTMNANADQTGTNQGPLIEFTEGARVNFVSGVGGTPNSGNPGYESPENHYFSEHELINGAAANFVVPKSGGQPGEASIKLQAYIETTTPDGIGNNDDLIKTGNTAVLASSLIIINAQGDVYTFNYDADNLVTTQGGYEVTFYANGDPEYGSVDVAGVTDGTRIALFSEDDYNAIEYVHLGADDFALGGFGASIPGEEQELTFDTFPLEVVDADGDTAEVDPISITLEPEGLDLIGDGGNNILVGGAGDDILTGAAGNDTLVGSGGNDTFVFSLAGDDGDDTITDFDSANDVLKFTDVIDSGDGGNIDLVDLTSHITGVTDNGDGSSVVVTFDTGATLTFEGAGTVGNTITSIDQLVGDPSTQIDVS